MNEFKEYINEILADWDPIGVGKEIATEEYSGYISAIIKHAYNKQVLKRYLETVLTQEMGLLFPKDGKQYEDMERICKQIIVGYKKMIKNERTIAYDSIMEKRLKSGRK